VAEQLRLAEMISRILTKPVVHATLAYCASLPESAALLLLFFCEY
jgi:hypothetical protein